VAISDGFFSRFLSCKASHWLSILWIVCILIVELILDAIWFVDVLVVFAMLAVGKWLNFAIIMFEYGAIDLHFLNVLCIRSTSNCWCVLWCDLVNSTGNNPEPYAFFIYNQTLRLNVMN